MTQQEAEKRAKARLDVELSRFLIELQSAAQKCLRRKVFFVNLTQGDKLRLFNLRMWTQRYQVSLEYILGILFTVWLSDRFNTNKRQPIGLGVPASRLTGAKSKAILKDAIRRDFPTGENRVLKRSQLEEDTILSDEVMGVTGAFRVTDPMHFVRAYRDRVRRGKQQVAELQETLSRRAWRGNPFR